MKKKFFGLALAAGAMMLAGTGCSSIESSKVSAQVNVKFKEVKVDADIEAREQQVTGSATVHTLFGFLVWGANAEAVGVDYYGTGWLDVSSFFISPSTLKARNAAAYNALAPLKADLILAPQYTLTTEDFLIYKKVNCKVKGFPGFVKKVKIAKPSDKTVQSAK